MRFMGLLTLVVLPLFLWLCIRITAKSEFGSTVAAKIIIAIFYLFIALCLLGFFSLLFQII